MLDTSNSSFTPSSNSNWHNSVSYGDILKYRFPGLGQPAAARPATRACLVLDIETIGGRRCAVLVPAVPARRPDSAERAVTLMRQMEYRKAGLEGPTRFPIRSRLIVPLGHDGFVASQTTGTPVIGKLESSAFERMNVERARLHALRDIRQDREQDQRKQRRRPQCGQNFSVTRRGVRRPIPMSPAPVARSGS
ncbi:hypothetical protein [Roseovarius nanhaiticus]|uniref:hypothetical protein n=1 Tax=Roseovarius nanhaiticus TaxID=573024 RepID=UPI0024908EA5|nr:hypothetical protein [Roseovarius nanhaiticus]